MFRSSFFFRLLMLGVAGLSLRAQTPADEIVNVNLRFMWASPLPLPALGTVKGEPPVFTPITAARLGFGSTNAYRGPRMLRLHRPPVDGLPPLAGEALLPAGKTSLIALVRPNPGAPDGVVIDFVPESASHFPLNSFLIVNLTGSALDGRFAGNAFTLQPGINAPLLSPAHAEPPPALQLAIHYKQRVIPLIDSPMIFAPDTRGLMLLLPPPRAGSRNILTFFIRDPAGPSGS